MPEDPEPDEQEFLASPELIAALDDIINNVLPKVREASLHIDRLGSFGWTVPTQFNIADVAKMLMMETKEAVDGYLLEYYALVDPNLTQLEQGLTGKEIEECQPLLGQCFSAFRRGEYAILMSGVTSIFERLLRKLLPKTEFYKNRFLDYLRSSEKAIQNSYEGLILARIFRSVVSFQKWFYAQLNENTPVEFRPNRHGLQHGTQLPANNRLEAIRLFNAIGTLASLLAILERYARQPEARLQS